MKLTVIICLTTLIPQYMTKADPCTSYKSLPRAAYRGGRCEFNPNKALCDHTTSLDWYRANANGKELLIQTTPAEFSTCGTKFPFWMNGSLPMDTTEEVSRTMCRTGLESSCDLTTEIKVKNCSTFYVYELPPTDNCASGYCFGQEEDCPPFDPCDFYERYEVDFDENVCSQTNKCDSFNSSAWYLFDGNNFLQVLNQSSHSQDSTEKCITDKHAWIQGEPVELVNGTLAHTLCIRNSMDDCSESVTLLSKQCQGTTAGFHVYNLPSELSLTCGRICIDTASPEQKWFSCRDTEFQTTHTSKNTETPGDHSRESTTVDSTTVNSDRNNSAPFIRSLPLQVYTIALAVMYTLSSV